MSSLSCPWLGLATKPFSDSLTKPKVKKLCGGGNEKSGSGLDLVLRVRVCIEKSREVMVRRLCKHDRLGSGLGLESGLGSGLRSGLGLGLAFAADCFAFGVRTPHGVSVTRVLVPLDQLVRGRVRVRNLSLIRDRIL